MDRNHTPDQHSIETPEQVRLEFAIAGIGSRFLAMAVDTLIQTGVAIVLGIVFAMFAGFVGAAGFKQGTIWVVAALGVLIFLLMFGYFAAFEILWNGQTPGKKVAHIRVVNISGRPLTPVEAIGRNLMRIVDQLPVFYGVGITTMLINSQNRRLGDLVAGSIVVRETSFDSVKPVWQTAETRAPEGVSLGAAALTEQDLALIDNFLNRRHELPADVRSRMAEQILGRLRPKLTIPEGYLGSLESTLESLAYERRSIGGYGS